MNFLLDPLNDELFQAVADFLSAEALLSSHSSHPLHFLPTITPPPNPHYVVAPASSDGAVEFQYQPPSGILESIQYPNLPIPIATHTQFPAYLTYEPESENIPPISGTAAEVDPELKKAMEKRQTAINNAWANDYPQNWVSLSNYQSNSSLVSPVTTCKLKSLHGQGICGAYLHSVVACELHLASNKWHAIPSSKGNTSERRRCTWSGCGEKKEMSLGSLHRHIVHTHFTRMMCPDRGCPQTFARKESLDRHILGSHDIIVPKGLPKSTFSVLKN